ncbi:MAG: glutamate racemase [Clostridia bacterium]|nr:glutamate racemase [Clostridia bacterium]
MDRSALPIGIFDSGMGGLSVLRTALRMLPGERFLFYGDIANAPYGTKTEDEVYTCARAVTGQLMNQGIKALVIACNTATCAAAAQLRAEFPDFIIVGMEPALKLAHDQCPEGRILVLATPVSLASQKYRRLYENYGEHAVSLPCPGLMEFVEQGDTESNELKAYLKDKFAPYLAGGQAPSAVVLGCTHYVFLKNTVQSLLPAGTRVLDGNEGTVRQLGRRLEQEGLISRARPSGERFSLGFHLHESAEETDALARKLLQIPEY